MQVCELQVLLRLQHFAVRLADGLQINSNRYYLLMGVFAGLRLPQLFSRFHHQSDCIQLVAMIIAVCAGYGNGVIFKLVPLYFNKQAGIVNGIVSMMGGLGGFFPPLLLSVVYSMTGSYSIGFMAFSQVALVSLVLVIWFYYMDRLKVAAVLYA